MSEVTNPAIPVAAAGWGLP